VNGDILSKTMRCKNVKDTWDTLERLYVGDGKLKKPRLQAPRKQYEMLTMEEGESISQYFEKLVNLTNQMIRMVIQSPI